MSSSFVQATAVAAVGPTSFTVDIHPGWTIGGRPNGGYLLATLGRAAASVSAQPHVLTATGTFLASPDPGPATVEVEVLRTGRTVDQVRARLSQGSTACLEAAFTLGRLDPSSQPRHQEGFPAAPSTGPQDGQLLPAMMPDGTPVAIMGEVDLRLDSLHVFTSGPSGRGELSGWLDLPRDDGFDPLSLVYAADALPPATFDIALTGWVPTLELTVHVRALPAPGPVHVLHQARLIDDGRVDEVCTVRDVTGRIVAHSLQLAGIRLP